MRLISAISAALLLVVAGCVTRSARHSHTDDIDSTHVISDNISNNNVTSFAEDADGHVWIGTDRGLNRYNINEYHQYFSDTTGCSVSHDHINQVYRDRHDSLWVATFDGVSLYTDGDVFRKVPIDELSQNATQLFEDNDGRLFLNMNVHLCEYDRQKGRFVSRIHRFDPYVQFNSVCYVDRRNLIWVVNPSLLRSFDSGTMQPRDSIPLNGYYTASMLDSDGHLWLGAKGSIRVFDVNRHRFIDTPAALRDNERLKKLPVSHLHPYGNKIIGVSDKRLFVYDKDSSTLVFDDEINFPFKAPGFKISTIYNDKAGNVWFGSHDQGYKVVYRHQDRFANQLSAFFRDTSVVSMAASGDKIAILTIDKDIYIYDRASNNPPRLFKGLPEEIEVCSLKSDNEGNIWLMTVGKAYRARIEGDSLTLDAGYDTFLPLSLVQDRHGTVWIGSGTEKMYALRKGADKFASIQIRPKTFTFTPDLRVLDDGRIAAVTFDAPLLFMNPDTWEFTQSKIRYDNTSVPFLTSKFAPTTLFQDSHGTIWVGTLGNGLLQYHTRQDSLSRVENLSCRDICDIQEDNDGNIWISTKYGLNRYDYGSGKVSRFYMTDGTGGNQFYPKSSLKFDDGTIMFGGTHGITVFDSSEIARPHDVKLSFENLKIHNKLVVPAHSDAIDRLMSHNPDITLTHDQNSFGISFVALEYDEFDRLHYMYMLEGVDPHWIDAGNNREVFYSNLAPGRYTFRVKATDPDTDEIQAENSLNVTVRPAPYLSWWAKLIYLLVILLAIYVGYSIYSRIRKEKRRARLAEQERLQEQKVNEMNMSFFANISHEFRTPLTLISGPVAELSQDRGLSESERNLMAIVKRNVTRMQKLVNQILDFHKLENDTLKLEVREADVIGILKDVVDTFAYNARQKGITLVCYGLEDSFRSLVDADKLEKITYNLLSNAIKYTPSGGQIEVSFDILSNAEAVVLMPELESQNSDSTDYMKITVADSGPGIPEKQLLKVFERYYQCEGEGRYNWGTGIGLYYARELARIHHGWLIAGNRPGTGGAVLTLCIPLSETAFHDHEKVASHDAGTPRVVTPAPEAVPDTPLPDSNRKRILVVDDDIEIANYIKSLFDESYNVICRHDADSAFNALPDFNPDMVISDVVMPGKSGFELCNDIKGNSQYCHIPVVLLTAKYTVNEQVEGLNSGADYYVTKPFEPSYLIAIVRTTLDNRDRLKEILTANTASTATTDNQLSPNDRKFMDEIYAIMERELSNSELDVVKILDVLKISRTKLYYKLKGLTGQTPASFFKIYKLNRAAELLKEGRYNISEIADMTGFSTLSHFSTSFKKHFGVSPSDYQ